MGRQSAEAGDAIREARARGQRGDVDRRVVLGLPCERGRPVRARLRELPRYRPRDFADVPAAPAGVLADRGLEQLGPARTVSRVLELLAARPEVRVGETAGEKGEVIGLALGLRRSRRSARRRHARLPLTDDAGAIARRDAEPHTDRHSPLPGGARLERRQRAVRTARSKRRRADASERLPGQARKGLDQRSTRRCLPRRTRA